MKRLFLSLIALTFWIRPDYCLAQDASGKVPPEFVWETNSLDAFVKAVEQNKPMVVLFGSLPEFRNEKGGNLTNDIRKEFNAQELNALRERAVFTLGLPEQDEYARRMAAHLKLTVYPTISVIAPRTDRLTETYRMEGFFKRGEILHDLNLALPGQPQVPVAAPADAPAEKAALSDADKKAISGAVAEYEAALKAGDLDKVAKLTAQPFGFLYEQGLTVVRGVGEAKRGILDAMDERFGKQEDTIPYGPDEDRVRRRLMKLKALNVLDLDTAIGKIVTVQVEAVMTNGKTEAWKLVANRPTQPDGKWMVWPKPGAGVAEIGGGEAWQNNMKKLATAYDGVAADIRAGKYDSREKAKQAAFEAYSRAISPTFGDAPPIGAGPAGK